MPVEELVDQIERWREHDAAAPRLRVVRDATRTLQGLSPDERRVLARGLAERGAPELASRVARRSGLTRDDAQHLATQLLSLDRGALDQLSSDLRSDQQRRRLLEAAGEQLSDRLPPDPSSRVEGLPPPPGDHLPSGRAPTEPPPGARSADAHRPVTDVAATHDDTDHDDTDHDDTDHGDGTWDEDADHDGDGRDDDHDDAWDEDADAWHEAARIEPARDAHDPDDPLATAVRSSATARERFEALAGRDVDVLTGGQVVDVLHQLPDGWQRRRAVRRLVDEGAIDGHDLDANAVVTAVERASDRAAIANTLVAAGLVHLETVTDALTPAHAARLRRRASRTRR